MMLLDDVPVAKGPLRNGLDYLFEPDWDEDFVEWLICHTRSIGMVWTDGLELRHGTQGETET